MAWFAFAAAFSLLPYYAAPLGGDAFFHLVAIQCFAGQLWQGDIYPRWCFSADAGLGSPLFFFYYPLPYYVTALFYPLTWIGVSVQACFVLSMWLASVVAGWACWRWLREAVGERCALLAALVYLLLPYRSEVLFFRDALAEAWAMAFVPLICLYAQRMTGAVRFSQVARLALVIALALLCHVQVTGCALMGVGVYVLARKSSAASLAGFVGAVAGAVALSSFYWWPAMRYLPFIDHAAAEVQWVNRVILPVDFLQSQARSLVGFILSLLALGALFWVAWRRLEGPLRKECVAWGVAALVGVVLTLPVAAPLWGVINRWGPVAFPWRMQLVAMQALAFMSAVYMAYLLSARARRTARVDYALLVLLLLFFAFFQLQTTPRGQEAVAAEMLDAGFMAPNQYRTVWTPRERAGVDGLAYVMEHWRQQEPKVDVTMGAAVVKVSEWSWRGIGLEVEASGPAKLRLQHRYFPCWRARFEDGRSGELVPEVGTGLMMLAVPAGRSQITMRCEP